MPAYRPDPAFKQKLLAWGSGFHHCVYLDSCSSEIDRYGRFEFILAVADESTPILKDWEALQENIGSENEDWWFGVLSYDLKNRLEPSLETQVPLSYDFPELYFFRATHWVYQEKGSTEIQYFPNREAFGSLEIDLPLPQVGLKGSIQSNLQPATYLKTVSRLRQHIKDGDCYEINFAQEFSVQAQVNSPAALWWELTAISPTPFAGCARFGDLHLLCASPERFLQAQGDRLITQPIKGTAPRDPDPDQDAENARRLRASLKEQAENVMIVDLSRNDLYRSAIVNGVDVPELFAIQSFPKVHHLVSTIRARKRPEIGPVEALSNTFPPGSMTGAPKVRTCELIDAYEPSARGLYSGSLGYFAPGGDFDFNVVIRSMIYDAGRARLSFHVGGAITWDSDPQAEFQETLIKARAIREVLGKFSGKSPKNS